MNTESKKIFADSRGKSAKIREYQEKLSILETVFNWQINVRFRGISICLKKCRKKLIRKPFIWLEGINIANYK